MTNHDTHITALFADDAQAAEAVSALRQTQWPVADVHGPIPSQAVSEALGIKKSGVGWFTLAGGVFGFFLGYFLAVFTSARWGLIVSGKPVLSYIPFFIVGFEFTILFSVLANVLGLILLMRLPANRDLPRYRPECSADRFGVVVGCRQAEAPEVRRFLTELGGEMPGQADTQRDS
ncbi:MAG: DUF3341 domain-containing protein [Desulfobacteraceae bacterium]|nr:DUF3341 domain-containing protein [Desulfobacteraceae bacterium]